MEASSMDMESEGIRGKFFHQIWTGTTIIKIAPYCLSFGRNVEMLEARKKRVLDLYYKEGRNTREIASIERISIRDISTVLKEEETRKQNQEDHVKNQLEEIRMAEAYRLFEIGKSPIQVAIELKLREPLVSKLYKDYLNLTGLAQVVLLCNKIGDYAWDYLKLYELACRDGISNEKVVRAAGAIQELPYAEQRLQKLIRESDNLEEKKKQLRDDVNFFGSRRSKLREEIFRLAENICRKEEKLGQLQQKEEGIERIMLKHQKVIPMQRQRAVEDVAFEGGEVHPMNEGDIV